MYEFCIEKVNLNNQEDVLEVKKFLSFFSLDLDKNIDYTLVIRQGEEIKGTCSKSGNVLKCFAISNELRGEGLSEKLITALNDKLFDEGIYHSFIFTKPENIPIFTGLNYKLVEQVNKVALLESGIYNIDKYLEKISQKYLLTEKKERASIVMNCNPFTLGHRYLIEQAAKESEEVLIFIVQEEKSLFPFKVRYNLVREGVKDLKNVKVIEGGEYIISSATFPTYFLREKNDILNAYTDLDSKIFLRYYCSKFNIVKRFVGEEPFCKVTEFYNKTLKENFKKFNKKLIIIERKAEDGEKISASRVRELLKQGRLKDTKNLLPMVTFKFLCSEEGKKIIEKIKDSNSLH
ncbi:[citrate (pro-3S)-lyase] ligase [Hathewaya limosa]|uniref:[Citrate [pro-3S]-lyase] ligase n=1 Tax=Hathewaya limosa TaxID=1536 RepID=A0ABU0JSG7_HATLI|nr:[citrate (pro-3S)-lyase] ligase [Hathewaya limosa]MDQ0480046.1 [citrate (pro-3S)-lyase] ligase [Hathewaya limosa]